MPDARRRRLTLIGLAIASVVAVVVSLAVDDAGDGDGSAASASQRRDGSSTTGEDVDAEPEEPEEPDGERFRTDYAGLADPAGFGRPYPNATVEGLLTFRGNPSRSYYGVGPVPRTTPRIVRTFPDAPMCRESTDLGVVKVWCGMGWTGQPTIVEREDRTWAIFGGYDGNLHFMDADTGERILPDVETGDIVKGTPTIDPEGYPLAYTGSRDNLLRVVAFDRAGAAEVLWQLDSTSVQPVKWNDDWDSSPIVVGDHMIVGSESSRFWVVKLNRSYDDAGLVQVAPEVVFTDEAWDEQVIADNDGDQRASVESSVTVVDDVAYFGTSAGLVLGYDLSGLAEGRVPEQVFRFYSGGDNDASIVADEEGFLYAAAQNDRPTNPRAQEVGQLQKLDPTKPEDPVVWSFQETSVEGQGLYGTPAVLEDVVIITSAGGRLIGLDRGTGGLLWERTLGGAVWGSAVVVDDVLLIGDCEAATFRAFDLQDPRALPPELWTVDLGGCIEATAAVWKGRIYIGSRAGYLYTLE